MVIQNNKKGEGHPIVVLRQDGILHVNYPKEITITAERYDRVVRKASALPGGPFPVLVTAHRGNPFDPKIHAIAHREDSIRHTAAVAIVTPGALEKFLANIFLSFITPPTPWKAFSSEPEATEWLLDIMKNLPEKKPIEIEHTDPVPVHQADLETSTLLMIATQQYDTIIEKTQSIRDRQKYENNIISPLEISFIHQEYNKLQSTWSSINHKIKHHEPSRSLIQQLEDLDQEIKRLKNDIDSIKI